MKTVRISLYIMAAVICCSASATTFYVPADGTLQEVIGREDCRSGDEIEIAMGTYSGPGYRNVNFWGKNVIVRSTDPGEPEVVASTIIDCQNLGRAFIFQNGETAEAQVAGLTIVNANNSAIWIVNSHPTISQCVISGCSAMFGGAIRVENGSSPKIDRCLLVGNTATSGGAVYIIGGSLDRPGGSPVLKNCVIAGNTAMSGGGAIYSQNVGSPQVMHCTITDNYSGGNGGAIWCYGGSNMTIYGSILWNNTATQGSEMLVGGPGPGPSIIDMSYCDVLNTGIEIVGTSSLSGVGNIAVDPMFMEGDWRLSDESLCIDAGDVDYIAEVDETDVYGQPRISGSIIDMGAAEYLVQEETEITGAHVRLWPKVVNLSGKQNFLFCTIKIEGCESEQIDSDSILMEGLLEPVWTKKFKCVRELVVRFDMQEVAAMVMDDPSDTLVLTVTGSLLDGTLFTGSDTLKVYNKPRHPLGKNIVQAKQMIQAKAAARAKQVIQTQAAQAKQNQACANSSKGNSKGK